MAQRTRSWRTGRSPRRDQAEHARDRHALPAARGHLGGERMHCSDGAGRLSRIRGDDPRRRRARSLRTSFPASNTSPSGPGSRSRAAEAAPFPSDQVVRRPPKPEPDGNATRSTTSWRRICSQQRVAAASARPTSGNCRYYSRPRSSRKPRIPGAGGWPGTCAASCLPGSPRSPGKINSAPAAASA